MDRYLARRRQIFEAGIVMDKRIYYVWNVILETVWLEEKAEATVSSFAATVALCRVSENMTGTDQDNTEMDSRLLVSFVVRTMRSRIYI
jgi:hypothetical protein